MSVRTWSTSEASSSTTVTGSPVRCWSYSSVNRLTCWSCEDRSRKSNWSRGAPSRLSRCISASRVGTGGSPGAPPASVAVSPRRSTTHAPRNWSRRWCAARTASAVRPLPGGPCSSTTVGLVSVLARAWCTHWEICVSSALRPANGPSASGRCWKDCSSTLRRRAAALRSLPRSLGTRGGAAAGCGAVPALRRVAAVTIRCWSRNGRMPRTSTAVSHWSRNCSVPPGCPRIPARRCAAGQCPAVSLTSVAAAPATATVAPAPNAVPAEVPYPRSAPKAATAATIVTSPGVASAPRDSRADNGRRVASASSRARTYAPYSSAAFAAISANSARPRASSTAPSVRPPDRRTSSSTARANRPSTSVRWLSRRATTEPGIRSPSEGDRSDLRFFPASLPSPREIRQPCG